MVLPIDIDRAVMGFSLSIHIILAAVGVALPLILITLEYLGVRYNDNDYKMLAKRLSVVFLVLFAVGSSSGVLVALELNLLWPKFMALVGQVAITPLIFEGFAFFMETVFIGVYVYSWDKFRWKYAHLLTAVPIAIGAFLSAAFIIMLNSFMNTPVGFNIQQYLSTGAITNIHPFAVFSAPAVTIEVLHGVSSTYFAGTMIFVGYMAYMLVKNKEKKKVNYYRKGLSVVLAIAAIAVVVTIITGVLSIHDLAVIQPEKYAAIEGNIHPIQDAPEMIGGIPIGNSTNFTDYIAIPGLQSLMLNGTTAGTVPGLSSYPASTWPPLIVHVMFDLMFFIGVGMGLFIAFFYIREFFKKDSFRSKPMLWFLGLCSIGAVTIMEIGWIMAEFARQPWIIYGVMTVSQAANTSPGILPAAFAILAFYIAVIPFTIFIIGKALKNQKL